MKLLQIERDALLKPLQAVTGIVEKRHTLPILSNVLLERRPDGLQLVATDLEIQISTRCEVGKGAGEQNLTPMSAQHFQQGRMVRARLALLLLDRRWLPVRIGDVPIAAGVFGHLRDNRRQITVRIDQTEAPPLLYVLRDH